MAFKPWFFICPFISSGVALNPQSGLLLFSRICSEGCSSTKLCTYAGKSHTHCQRWHLYFSHSHCNTDKVFFILNLTYLVRHTSSNGRNCNNIQTTKVPPFLPCITRGRNLQPSSSYRITYKKIELMQGIFSIFSSPHQPHITSASFPNDSGDHQERVCRTWGGERIISGD